MLTVYIQCKSKYSSTIKSSAHKLVLMLGIWCFDFFQTDWHQFQTLFWWEAATKGHKKTLLKSTFFKLLCFYRIMIHAHWGYKNKGNFSDLKYRTSGRILVEPFTYLTWFLWTKTGHPQDNNQDLAVPNTLKCIYFSWNSQMTQPPPGCELRAGLDSHSAHWVDRE